MPLAKLSNVAVSVEMDGIVLLLLVVPVKAGAVSLELFNDSV